MLTHRTAVLDKLIQTVTVLLRRLLKIPLWITNEMPKELKQANANGLKKATDNGKKKSPKVAVQQIMKQIATVTGNKDMDIDADGMYGPATIAAIKKAQELAGVTADGDPGAETAKKLVDFSKIPHWCRRNSRHRFNRS